MNRLIHLAFSLGTACGLLLLIWTSYFFRYHFKEMLGDKELPLLSSWTTQSTGFLVVGLGLYFGYSVVAAIRFSMTTEQVLLHAALSFLVLQGLFLVYGTSFTLPYLHIITSLVNHS